MHGAQGRDAGTQIHYALSAAHTIGVCAESAWTWDEGAVNEQPTWGVVRASADQRIVGDYARLDGTADEIRGAIAAEHPVVFGQIGLDQAFEDLSSGAIWPGRTGPSLGNHAMVAIGYDPDSVHVLSSWGKGWADGGVGRISWDAVAAWDDVWTLRLVPVLEAK
jgi:hypothetical protein